MKTDRSPSSFPLTFSSLKSLIHPSSIAILNCVRSGGGAQRPHRTSHFVFHRDEKRSREIKDGQNAGLASSQKWVQATGIDRTWQHLTQRLMLHLVRFMTPSTEPRVEWRRDRQGNSYFDVYDPITGRSHYFSSAHEVRAWLEQRYYQ